MPGIQNADQIRSLVGTTGRLDFVPLGDTQLAQGQQLDPAWLAHQCADSAESTNCVLFSGDQVAAASIGAERDRPADGRLHAPRPRARTCSPTTPQSNIGKYFAIVLDGEVISAPVINSSIPNGQVQIESGGDRRLPAGRGPEPRHDPPVRPAAVPDPGARQHDGQPDARRRSSSSRACSRALIAILMVIVFMVVHYRLPGVVASGALIYYALVVYALFRLIPVTLTLAGVAGFVLSVGMAVDANILIFERTKEELRVGKSLPAAIEAGFNRAWNSILDSNVSSLITATILFLFGSSTIRGFGLVLIIGVLVSMFTAITVTRTVLRIVVAAAVGPEGVPVRRDRGGVPGPPDVRPRAARRGARACLTSSASAAGSSPSRS